MAALREGTGDGCQDADSFPSLEISVIGASGEHTQVYANPPAPVHIANAFFEGELLLLLRPLHPSDSPQYWESIFSGRQRLLEVQVQGRFKQETRGAMWLGGEVTERMELGLLTKSLARLLLNVIRQLSGQLHFSFGDRADREWAHICFPLSRAADRLVRTPPGETPPVLGRIVPEDDASRSARVKAASHPPFNTRDTYTFSINTRCLDLPNWRLVNLPGVRDMNLASFWNQSALRFVVYDSAVADAEYHARAKNKYHLAVQLAHTRLSGARGQRRLASAFEDEAEGREVPSVFNTGGVDAEDDEGEAEGEIEVETVEDTGEVEITLRVEARQDIGDAGEGVSVTAVPRRTTAPLPSNTLSSKPSSSSVAALLCRQQRCTEPEDGKAGAPPATSAGGGWVCCDARVEVWRGKGGRTSLYLIHDVETGRCVLRSPAHLAELVCSLGVDYSGGVAPRDAHVGGVCAAIQLAAAGMAETGLSPRLAADEAERRAISCWLRHVSAACVSRSAQEPCGAGSAHARAALECFLCRGAADKSSFLSEEAMAPQLLSYMQGRANGLPPPQMHGPIAYARAESIWREALAVLDEENLVLHCGFSNSVKLRLPLSSVMAAGPVPLTDSACLPPGFSYMQVETAARVHCMLFSTESVRDQWVLTLSRACRRLDHDVATSYVCDDGNEATVLRTRRSQMLEASSSIELFLDSSAMWALKRRRLLNCRRLAFDQEQRSAAEWCDVVADALRRSFRLAEADVPPTLGRLSCTDSFAALLHLYPPLPLPNPSTHPSPPPPPIPPQFRPQPLPKPILHRAHSFPYPYAHAHPHPHPSTPEIDLIRTVGRP